MNAYSHSVTAILLVFALFAGGCDALRRPAAPAADQRVPVGAQAPLFDGLGDFHYPITTKSPLAQRFFDQGLILSYAFNHHEAARSFREAARLDADCSMCWWGLALVLGPNINAPMDPSANAEAYAAAQQALATAGEATQKEQAFAQAIASRYQESPPESRAPLDAAYAEAMRQLANDYPEDDEALALFGEALMDTMPWAYWVDPATPEPATLELLDALERVIARSPQHAGALHLYIHTVEASEDPDRGEAAADALRGLVPNAGHLVHMPSHIYLRVGRYNDAVQVNQDASLADESYLTQCKAQGFYPALYYPHNVHFLWAAAMLDGRKELALESAHKLVEETPVAHCNTLPFIEEFRAAPYFTMLRFGMWPEALATKAPQAKHRYTTAMWHFIQGMALANTGKPLEASGHLGRMKEIASTEKLDSLGLASGSTAGMLLAIAEQWLLADIAAARGQLASAVRRLESAVALEDKLPYSEPPPWPVPSRHALGAALIAAKRAPEASAVYEQDLAHYRNNGWALLGMAQAERERGHRAHAELAEELFSSAWERADHVPETSRN